jgi:glycosyltransferase involved in cell wall biosynthesis
VKVALLSDVFAGNMGYLENILPKFLGRQGVDVHVIAMDLPPYYWMKDFAGTYGEFSEQLQPGTVEARDGYTLHILDHKKILGYMRMVGLREKLATICPDVVQTTAPIGWTSLDAAFIKASLGYKLFTGNHYHASVFPLANKESSFWSAERLRCVVTRSIPGWLVSHATEKCYAIAEDCADVAVRFFGVPRSKIEICPLGVDTDLFHPSLNARDVEERLALRKEMGFAEREVVCVYSGRFSEDKNPLLLARAVAEFRKKGEPYRGLFIGNGAQAEPIQRCEGCVTHPFVPIQKLGALYRAADVGVWPTQESLSMLDAAACGLPIIANQSMTMSERIEGNGLTYILNDLNDLVRALGLLRESGKRQEMGSAGARKMAQNFSWESVAKRRLADYQAAMHRNGSFQEAGPQRIGQ